MHVVFCDNHILIVDKPAGLATQPDLEERAKIWVKERFNKPGNVFLHAIHRLDKPASGLVLFARTSKALSRLNMLMREHKISKTYMCRVHPIPSLLESDLEHMLVHGDHRAIVSSSGKKAHLHYRVIDASGLLEVKLYTGRYHQIRAQLAAIGAPIVGDAKYGSQRPWEKGIALLHVQLLFPHPVTGAMMKFSSKFRL